MRSAVRGLTWSRGSEREPLPQLLTAKWARGWWAWCHGEQPRGSRTGHSRHPGETARSDFPRRTERSAIPFQKVQNSSKDRTYPLQLSHRPGGLWWTAGPGARNEGCDAEELDGEKSRRIRTDRRGVTTPPCAGTLSPAQLEKTAPSGAVGCLKAPPLGPRPGPSLAVNAGRCCRTLRASVCAPVKWG